MFGAMDAHAVAHMWAMDPRPAIVLVQRKRRANPTQADLMAEVARLRARVGRIERQLQEKLEAETATIPQLPRNAERKT